MKESKNPGSGFRQLGRWGPELWGPHQGRRAVSSPEISPERSWSAHGKADLDPQGCCWKGSLVFLSSA